MSLSYRTLSSRQARTLTTIELSAAHSIRTVSKKLKMREHTLHHEIQRLKNFDVLENRIILVNPSLLGVYEYIIYLTFSNIEDEESLERFILSHSSITWLAEAGGEFHYYLCFECTNILELKTFFELIGKKFGAIIHIKEIALITGFWTYGRKYLYKNLAKPICRSYETQTIKSVVNEKLSKTLNMLARNSQLTRAEVARLLKIPLNTLQRHIRQLEKLKVIVAYVYPIKTMNLGVHTYKAVIGLKEISASIHDKILSFAEREPNIVTVVRCLGSWDYELRIELEATQSAAHITKKIYKELGASISFLKIVPLFKFLKFVNITSNQI